MEIIAHQSRGCSSSPTDCVRVSSDGSFCITMSTAPRDNAVASKQRPLHRLTRSGAHCISNSWSSRVHVHPSSARRRHASHWPRCDLTQRASVSHFFDLPGALRGNPRREVPRISTSAVSSTNRRWAAVCCRVLAALQTSGARVKSFSLLMA